MMFFRDEYRFLSNFYIHPIVYDGVEYKTTEHAYQALKFSDPEIRKEIMNCSTPGKTKRMARQYQAHVNPTFVDRKRKIMYDINKIKFSDPELAQKLAEIDEPIVEGNTWGDTFWEVCDGEGENHLGKILERIKKENEVFN